MKTTFTAVLLSFLMYIPATFSQPFGGYGVFDGAGDYFMAENAIPHGSWTIEYIFKICGELNKQRCLMSNMENLNLNVSKNYCPLCPLDTFEYSRSMYMSDGFSAGVTGSDLPGSDGEWQYIVFQYNKGEDEIDIYWNGQQTGGSYWSFATVDEKDLYIGNSIPGAIGTWFMGYIDEIRISDHMLYPTCCTDELPFPTEGFVAGDHTVGLWHFDDTADPAHAADYSGEGHTMTAYGDAHVSGVYTAVIDGPAEIMTTTAYTYTAADMPVGMTASWICDGAIIFPVDSGQAEIAFMEPGDYNLELVTGDPAAECMDGTDTILTVHVIINPQCIITTNGEPSLCIGDSITLSLPEGYSYLWSTGDTVASITVNAGGLYTAIYYYAGGESATCQLNIEEHPLPDVVISATGLPAFCAYDSIGLFVSEDLNDYMWNTGDTTALITVSESGLYTVISSNSYGCFANDSITITVFAPPVCSLIPEGPVFICQGDSIDISAPGDMDYLWTTTETTQSITVHEADTFGVILTDSNGCISTCETEIILNPDPSVDIAAEDIHFCQQDSLLLIATSGYEYAWNTGSAEQGIVVYSSDTYIVTATDENGCSASDSIAVTADPLPVCLISADGPLSFYIGDSIMLSAPGGYACIWSTGETTSAITVFDSGTYSLIIIDNNGCSSECSVEVIVTEQPDAVTVNEDYFICIYPTVTDGILWIESTSPNQMLHTEIYNLSGNEIYSTELLSGKFRLELNNLPAGIYIIKIFSGMDVYKNRFILL